MVNKVSCQMIQRGTENKRDYYEDKETTEAKADVTFF